MEYRLGLDIGTNSIGWCMLRLNNGQPVSVIKAGSRIFSDGRVPKSGESLAVERRDARSMRRNLKRRGQRTALLMKDLIKYGLLPENEGERKALALLDPYELRAKAIREEIPTYSLGRVLMHLSKRRGFKSNRIAERKSKENGKIKPAIERFQKEMKEKGCETAGEYFYYLIKEGKTVRIRLGSIKGEKEGYERYLDRSMVWEEFNKIMTRQKAYRKELTEGVIERLARDIFYQRPLKPVDPGKCSIFPDEKRIAKAYPAAQDFIMLQKINDLRVNIKDEFVPQPPLTNEEKNVLKEELRKKRKMTFNEIRKTFAKKGFSADYGEFSHESTEKDLPGNVTNAVMASKELFGEKWYKLTEEERKEIIRRLLSVQDDDTAISEYLIKNFGLTEQEAENVLDKGFSSLPEGYLKYGEKALSLLLPFMDDQNMDLTSAKIEAGISETSDNIMADGSYDFLPYYGIPLESHVAFSTGDEDDPEEKRYGKIANPTVHIALNQLRKLINEIIELYGKPAEIVVELARDLKNSMEEKKRITKKNQENRKENEKFTEELNSYGQQTTKDNMLKMKLWHELDPIDRVCVYSGKKISCRELFTDEVQIEHILPFSRTLDDGYANKILSMREANYYKANRSPYEAFGKSEDGYDYNEIMERAGKLPENKRWRFNQDAMEKYDEERGFLSRQLNDTRYLSKIAKKYLGLLYPEKEREARVRAIPGTLTGLIRGKLGLNDILSKNKNKNRNDHRHHAVDAFVVAVTTRSLLQKVATAAENPQRRNRLIENMPVPYEGYFKDVENAMETIKVSHKQDRGLTGRLHEDTSYGLVKNGDKEIGNLVRRKPAKSLTDKEYLSIRDSEIRKIINGVNIKDEEERKIMTEEIDSFIASNKIRSLRLLKKDEPVIPIKNRQGEVYKAFTGGSNVCVEIYRLPDGTIKHEVIQRFDANQPDFRPKWTKDHPEAKLLYRLFKGDVVRYKENDKYAYFIIKQIKKDKSILLPLHEGGQIKIREEAENRKIYVSKSYSLLFNDLQAQPVNISVTGLVKKAKYADPFFWEKR